MGIKNYPLRVPEDDMVTIKHRAEQLGLSVNAYIHQTVMADANRDVARMVADAHEFLARIEADPTARDAFDEADRLIDPKPRTAGRRSA